MKTAVGPDRGAGPVVAMTQQNPAVSSDPEQRDHVPVRRVAACAVRTGWLLAHHRLHLRRAHVGMIVVLPDGREYEVFRESTCDQESSEPAAMLTVWFQLRGIPPGARLRRRLFERLSVLNTLLFAGAEGYLVKLWMVDPATSGYAGLYSWNSPVSAEDYGRYITAILRPLSRPGSTGYHIYTESALDDYLAHHQDPRS